MFSCTNLLTSCHSAVACFLLFLVPEMLVRKYSRNWTGQKPKSIFHQGEHGVQRRDGGDPQGGHTPQARPTVGPRLGRVWAPWPPPSLASSPIRILRCRNPKYPINIPRNRL